MRVNAYSWVGVGTVDFDATILFFADAVGLSLAQRKDESQHALFRLPSGQDFEVFGPRSRWYRLQTYPVLGFEIRDIERSRTDLEARGVEFVSDVVKAPGWGMFCYFCGPDSYLYELVQRCAVTSIESMDAISGYRWIGLPTTDYSRAIQFFAEVIALPLESHEDANETTTFRLPCGQLLEIFGPRSPQPECKYMQGPCIGFEVKNVQRLYQNMVLSGVSFVATKHAPNSSARAYFFGPDDRLYAIQQRSDYYRKNMKTAL